VFGRGAICVRYRSDVKVTTIAFLVSNLLLFAIPFSFVVNDSSAESLAPRQTNISAKENSIEISEKDTAYFVPGMVQRHEPLIDINGGGSLSFSIVSGPVGLTVNERFGYISWEPPLAEKNTRHIVEYFGVLNGVQFELSTTVNVLPVSAVNGTLSENTFTVVAEWSSLKDVVFSYPEDLPTQFGINEVPIGSLPPLLHGLEPITGGYYSGELGPTELYFPIDILSDPSDIVRVRFYSWYNNERWLPISGRYFLVEIDQRSYVKMELIPSPDLSAAFLKKSGAPIVE